MRRPLVTAALAIALVVAACSDDSGGGADTTTASGGGTATIRIADFAYDGPDSIDVGTTVTVTNEDGVAHTFTSEDDVFDSDSIASGESFEFTFDEAGEFTYFCKFHPQMTGTITVGA